MIATYRDDYFVWVDLNSPTKEELSSVSMTYGIEQSIIRDMATPTPKQYVTETPNALYTVMKVPSLKKAHSLSEELEIDFAIQEKSLVTARYDTVEPMHRYAKKMEVDSILNSSGIKIHPFFGVMQEIYKNLSDELSHIEDWTKEIEKNIFSQKEKEMVFAISAVGRNLINFRRIIDPHENVWQELMDIGKEKFGKDFKTEANKLSDEYKRLSQRAESQSRLVTELRETNNAMLSTKQNEITKTLTILAFSTFPLSVVAAVFGMNTAGTPIIGQAGDFWMVIGIMVLITLLMFGYFKYKKWI